MEANRNIPAKNHLLKKVLSYITLICVLVLAGFVYYNYYFVFGTGVKFGELNYIVRKGIIFKTNEGRLIQAGYKSGASNSIQSNEFRFCVTDERVMKQLESSSGRVVQLHYNEYIGILPWRGMSNYVVDSIISSAPSVNTPPLP